MPVAQSSLSTATLSKNRQEMLDVSSCPLEKALPAWRLDVIPEEMGILNTTLCQSVPTHFISEMGTVELCSAVLDTVLQDLDARDPQMAELGRNGTLSV